MATSDANAMVVDSTSTDSLHTHLLMADQHTVISAVDYKGRPAVRSKHGRWRSAFFIIVVEMAERISYYGMSANLITFLTDKLGQSTATAAANVNDWSGAVFLLPLVGSVIADSFLGRFYTIIAASLLYILGLGFLTLLAMLPSLNCVNHSKSIESKPGCSPYSQIVTTFFVALYLVAVGLGGHKPCVQAFGADQFDGENPVERKAKSSFFNWWYFGFCVGALIGIGVLSYVQDNLSWGLGFGIPCIIMVVALLVFLLGTITYRYIVKGEGQSPFTRIGSVFVAASRNWRATHSDLDNMAHAQGIQSHHGSRQLRFLNKALLAGDSIKGGGRACSISEVEEAKAVLRLFPIWSSCLIFAILFSQTNTFFTKQGVTLDRSIGPSFTIPPATLQSFMVICVLIVIPIYDRVFVPIARSLTGKPAGITMLQRIGTGLFVSTIAMIVAAITEKQRLNTALKQGLIDLPNETIPMSIWWLLPQYGLLGTAEAFTMIGLQEFFYDQVPSELRSVGMSLYLSIFGVGSFLSSAIVSIINKATRRSGGGESWFSNNLNRVHLDYFYWLLAGLSAVGLTLFICSARSYIYNRKNTSI